MKGIILAGGLGTRLYPSTRSINKHLVQVYDKPLIYYPLSTLISLGIWDIAIISSPKDLPLFTKLLEPAKDWGVNLSYIAQKKPAGVAEVFSLGRKFVGKDNVFIILGDNVFQNKPHFCGDQIDCIYTTESTEPQNYGVVYRKGTAISCLAEKPPCPQSREIITGLYHISPDSFQGLATARFKEGNVVEALNRLLDAGSLQSAPIEGYWADCGSPKDLLKTAKYVSGNNQFGYPEYEAAKIGLISWLKYREIVSKYPQSEYRSYFIKDL